MEGALNQRPKLTRGQSRRQLSCSTFARQLVKGLSDYYMGAAIPRCNDEAQ